MWTYPKHVLKINKTTSLLHELQNNLPREPLVTIYKSFIRLHLDYGDMSFDQMFNCLNSFHERLESIQYSTCNNGHYKRYFNRETFSRTRLWILTAATMIQETLSLFQNNKESISKVSLIPTIRQAYMTRHKNTVPLFNVKHDYFKNSFFPSTVVKWNKLDSNIRNSEILALFNKRILAFIRHFANSTFQCHNPKGLKLITRLQLGLSHLWFH